MAVHLYRLHCITEDADKTIWGTTQPAVCPTNPIHVIDFNSITVVDTLTKNIITVHPFLPTADFTTIKEAVNFSNSVLPALTAVSVNPGIYYEDNPIVVGNGISVIGSEGPLGCTVIALNPTLDLFQIGNGSIIQDMTMVGGNVGVNYDGSTGSKAGSILRGAIIIDASIGIRSCTGPGELFCVNSLVRVGAGNTNTGYECTCAGKMRCFTSGTFGLPGKNIGTGVKCDGSGSLIVYFSGGFQRCNTAASVDNGGRLELKSSFIRNSGTALKVGSVSTLNKLLVADASLLESTTYDLDIQALAADVQIYGGTLRTDFINNPNNVTIFSNAYSTEPNNEANQILGELHVGTQYQPTETSIGQGDFYVSGMSVLTDDGTGTSFVNITNDAKNPAITSSFLQGLGVGNVIYIGSDVPFYGFDVVVGAAFPSGDSDKINKQYWNGAWTDMKIMVNSDTLSRTDVILENVETQRVRFGKMSGFTTTTVNGILKYWVRFQVNSLLTGPVATFSRILLHPSSTKINTNGYIEYLGNSRPIKTISIINSLPAATTLGSQNIFLSDNLDVGKVNNVYTNASTSRTGFNFVLPREIDTSYGMKLRWFYISTDTGGNIDWVLRWGWSNTGFDVYTSSGAAPPVGVNEQNLTFSTLVASAIGKQIDEYKILDIKKMNAVANPADMLWVTLERTSGDTHNGDVSLLQFQLEYVAFCEGGKISDF